MESVWLILMVKEDCYLPRHIWHESRQREQDIGGRIWNRGILLSQHILQRSEHLSTSEFHQRFPTVWAVYQVRVPRFYNAWCFLGVTWFNRTIGAEQLLIQIVLWSGTCGMNNTCQEKRKFVTFLQVKETGIKIVVSSLKRHTYQLNSWGFEIQVLTRYRISTKRATIPREKFKCYGIQWLCKITSAR